MPCFIHAMDQLLQDISVSDVSFSGGDGNTLRGRQVIAGGSDGGRTVLLLHGGGQTHHSWQGTAKALAGKNWRAITIDQRGHGQSDWADDGDYSFSAYASDLKAVLNQLSQQFAGPTVVIGASLGGLAGLLVAGSGEAVAMRALVLVDVTPQMKQDGVERILGFMAESSEQGFASMEEASDAIAAYLPHRPRPTNLSGLAKNLRHDADGRYRWHWDPRFLQNRFDAREHARDTRIRATEAAQKISVPTLLVRGRESELVGEAEARQFLDLVPHAKVSDVSGARHMVAGDRNDIFTAAVLEFLDTL